MTMVTCPWCEGHVAMGEGHIHKSFYITISEYIGGRYTSGRIKTECTT